MIDYPKILDKIFDKLDSNNASAIIIGGYIRDFLLTIPSKDIDIEVYGISSYNQLEDILQEFGDVCTVGKSFGVCKLLLDDLDLDFTLPRIDNHIASGHKGFEVCLDPNLDFVRATSRRDFTINAIGYDVKKKKILDPFGGREDLKNKVLRAVDPKTFIEDPLRVMRALQFAARFELHLHHTLFNLCQDMIQKQMLHELPKERIFEELKKLLLQSKRPSLGFLLLRDLGAFLYFDPFLQLTDESYIKMLSHLDRFAQDQTLSQEMRLLLFLALLAKPLHPKAKAQEFLSKLTAQKDILEGVSKILEHQALLFKLQTLCDTEIYQLAAKIEIKLFVSFHKASLPLDSKEYQLLTPLEQRAKELDVYTKPLKALVLGRDLISLGLAPSKEFKKILEDVYAAQMRREFDSHKGALFWLKEHLAKV